MEPGENEGVTQYRIAATPPVCVSPYMDNRVAYAAERSPGQSAVQEDETQRRSCNPCFARQLLTPGMEWAFTD